jgi:hypothetical protein
LSKSVEMSSSAIRATIDDKPEISQDGIERDADGFIVPKEEVRGFTDAKPNDGFDDSDDE